MMKYQQLSVEDYEQQFRERKLRHLQRKAARLGFTFTPVGAIYWQQDVRRHPTPMASKLLATLLHQLVLSGR